MFCELLQSWNIHFGLALCLHNNLCHDRLFLPLPLSSTPWPLSTHNLLLSNPYRTQKPYNYPVVQGEDNSYYLKHLFSGEWNGSGCIFLDFRNDASFADRHSIIYGHHMKNGTMFTGIDKYKKQEFFDEHPVALLITPDKNYKVDFFAGYVAAPQDDAWEIGFTEAEFEVWLQNAADRSCFTSEVAPNISDHILTLSTCSYEFDDARFVLAGVLR